MTTAPATDTSERFWHTLSALVVLGLTVAIVVTFRDYGISWDEPVQNTYGQDLLDYYRSDLRDRAALSYMNLFFYGGFFDLVAALLNQVSPFGVYETRHLWGGIVFLAGLFAAWRLTGLLAGARAAFLAVALLGVNALLYGHGFMNPKDAPLAWLELWMLYYAARAITEPSPRTSTLLGFAISTGLSLGTRVLAAPVLGYVVGALVLGALAHRYRPSNPPVRRATLGLAASLPLAYAVMVICWPWAIQKPFNPFLALHEFTNFPWAGQILWNGQMVMSSALPRDYLLVLLWYQLSEAVLVGLALAVFAGATIFARSRLAIFADHRTVPVLLVVAAAVVPLAGFSVLTPTIYNGVRHFLFVIPPLGVLAALGWDYALTFLRRRRFAMTAAGLIVASLAYQVSIMVRLHPYEYIAYNTLLGGARGAVNRFELDYWDLSFREAGENLTTYLAGKGETAPMVFICGNQLSAAAFLPASVRYTYRVEEADYLISDVPSPCANIADMTRNRVIEVIRDGAVLSYVLDMRAQRAETAAR